MSQQCAGCFLFFSVFRADAHVCALAMHRDIHLMFVNVLLALHCYLCVTVAPKMEMAIGTGKAKILNGN